jgi:anti-sigma B factor antagonist
MDVTIQLPSATPHAYLAWVAWWRDVEELLGSDLAVQADLPAPDRDSPAQGIVPAHVRAIEEEARRALDEGRSEIAPALKASPMLWSEWLDHVSQRKEWLEALTLKGLPVPRFPEDLVVLWEETLRTIQSQVSGPVLLGNLKILPDGQAGRFRLIGELEIANVEAVAQRLGEELKAGRRLCLDLSGLTFMDSKGLGLLLRLRSLAEESNLSPLVLVTPSSIVRKVLSTAVPHRLAGLEIWANQAP